MLRAQVPVIPGVVLLDRTRTNLQRTATLALTILPLLGVVMAITSMWGWGITAVDLSIAVSFYVLTMLGVTLGYHRLFTHGSFNAPRWLRFTLACLGSMAVQGAVVSWVADHRRHHAYSDQEGDPHSPHIGPGSRGRKFWRAHIAWLWRGESTSKQRWAPDVNSDATLRRLDSLAPLFIVLSLGLPALLGFALTGTLRGTVTAFIWGSGVRLFLGHHVTWSINSVSHTFGRRVWKTSDQSRNVWALSILSMGESWHNNHHAFPTSAFHGLRWWQIDVTALLIRLLAALHIITDVKSPTRRQMERLA